MPPKCVSTRETQRDPLNILFNFKTLEDSRRLAFQGVRKCAKRFGRKLEQGAKTFKQISVDTTRLEQDKLDQIYTSRDSVSWIYDGTTAHLIFQENRISEDKNKDLFFSPLASRRTNGLTVLVERTDTPFIPYSPAVVLHRVGF